MTRLLYDAVMTIPVPADLNSRVLTACRQQAAKPAAASPAVRYMPAVATAAACVAVLGVTLYATGQFSGGMATQPESDDSAAQLLVTEPTQPENTPLGEPSPLPSTEPSPSSASTATTDSTTVGTTAASGKGSAATSNKGGDSAQPDKTHSLKTLGRFEEMRPDELEAYFGRRIAPAWLPEDMVQPEIYVPRGIIYRDEEKIAAYPDQWERLLESGQVRDAEVIYDHIQDQWESIHDPQRSLTVRLSSAPYYPAYHLGDTTRFDEDVTVAGVPVRLAFYDDTAAGGESGVCYSAIATVDGVAYYVSAWNFTRTEFLTMLESLLE